MGERHSVLDGRECLCRSSLQTAAVSARGLILSPTGSLEICRDPDDNYLIELALLGRADYLVTEDADLYDDPAVIRFLAERDTRVVRVEEFARVLREAPQPGG
ncbi:MAG: putative toxin-antitoxin system toxin component, PIN family [Chloroflexi bacterium]|nr:putative toxin-antitoxin system toxin component, PIN family [Chloroflexota bacterium]